MSINFQLLAIGGINIAVGLRVLLQPQHSLAKVDKRKAELEAGAPERFFEERRALLAYPPPATIKGWHLKGSALLLLGIVSIGMSFFRPS